MGEMADYYRDLGDGFVQEVMEIDSDDKFRDGIWEGKDKDYRISEMDTFHVKNCIKMIKENPGWRNEYLTPLEERLKYLSEGRWTTSPFKRRKTITKRRRK
tara:strand:+ start:346 stop:648 length:303 start_codon:yes stop_codon:yes gene_type:complete